MTRPTTFLAALAAFALGTQPTLAANPWADNVVSYNAGTDPAPGFTDPTSALGEPTRISGPTSMFPSIVNPNSPAFGTDEIVSIGVGGSLTVSFDEPVTDDPLNPFGIDLLIFGNSFLTGLFGPPPNFEFDPNAPFTGIADEPGRIEVSADDVTYVEVSGVFADSFFPTNGYSDITELPLPFGGISTPGSVPSDFTKPVDPSLNAIGLTFPELIAAYDGSGGGVGVDLADVGLPSISFVRITNPGSDPTVSPEIDAFADVRAIPEPTAAMLTSAALLLSQARRRR
ncbi:MAG: hypothetical protein AAGA92_11990 [Planctomycetota bacterium]